MPTPTAAVAQPADLDLELSLPPGGVVVQVSAAQVTVAASSRWVVVPISTPTYADGKKLDVDGLVGLGATQDAAVGAFLDLLVVRVVELYGHLTMDGGTDGADLLGPATPPP